MRLRGGELLVLALFLLGTTSLFGCSDDSTPADTGGDDGAVDEGGADADADADVDADADADVVGGTVSVLVTFEDWPGEPVAAPGVVVAFDAPDGTRSEAPTGSDGRVTFDVTDWSAGTASLTAYAAGRQMVSRVGITAADGEVDLVLNRLGDPTGFVALSGTAANVAGTDESLAISATVPNVIYGSNDTYMGSDWHIHVPTGTACTIVATQRTSGTVPSGRGFTQDVGWALVEQAAVGVDTSVPLDYVADAATPTTVSGSFALPARAASPLHGPRSYGWVTVSSGASQGTGIFGITIAIEINADGTGLDYEMAYLQPAGVTDPRTCYFLTANGQGGGQQSWTCEDGWPTGGAHEPELLDAPVLRLSTGGTTADPQPLFEPVGWDLFDTNVHVALVLVLNSTGRWIWHGPAGDTTLDEPWIVVAPDDATGLTVPAPPSTTSVEAVLGTGFVVGFVELWREAPAGPDHSQIALSQTFVARP
jgi:hypothetical protein